jgi:hypothetical protein
LVKSSSLSFSLIQVSQLSWDICMHQRVLEIEKGVITCAVPHNKTSHDLLLHSTADHIQPHQNKDVTLFALTNHTMTLPLPFSFLTSQIEEGALLGTELEPGPSPLQIAAGVGDLERVEALLAQNVDVNALDPGWYGLTALQAATKGGQ